MSGSLKDRMGKALLAVGGVAVVSAGLFALWPRAGATTGLLRDGEVGFVLTEIAYVTGPHADEAGTCPQGMSQNHVEVYGATPEGARRLGESDQDYSARLEASVQLLGNAPDGRNYCAYPEIAPVDQYFRTMERTDVSVDGLDLDGVDSARSDFVAPNGTRGIDNQFYRATGCSRSYQPGGQSNQFGQTMLTGEWGVLISLADVDDLRNDDRVTVGFYANADPMMLSPARDPLRYATYALDQDPRFRAETTGRIVDGVLTTDPVDVRFRGVTNSMHLERVLRDARVRADITAAGDLTGILAGFAPVEALYDQQFGFRTARDGAGQPAPEPLRRNSANGAARVLGYTCQGIYQALNRLADAHPDPETGRNTAISVQYRFSAVNAFLVDIETGSVNDDLISAEGPRT